MKIYIQASELLLTPEEMKNRIPKEKLKTIQGKGILQGYVVAQEGISRPREAENKAPLILRWTKALIHRLADKIKAGTKFFINHGEGSNSHDGRKQVGEILASFVKTIKGKLSNVIIGHFPDEAPVKNADMCSMEAKIDTDENIVSDVEEVSAVALGNSNSENPAFPGAFRLATVQCFESDKNNESSKGEDTMGGEKPTRNEVIQLVKEYGLWPHELFDEETMKKDRTFGKLYDEKSTLTSENERLTKELDEAKTSGKEAIRKAEITDAHKKLDTLMGDAFTDKQKTYIKKQFNPETLEDLSETGLKGFIDKSKDDFAKAAKFFGVENPDIPAGGDGNKSTDKSSVDDVEKEALKELGV